MISRINSNKISLGPGSSYVMLLKRTKADFFRFPASQKTCESLFINSLPSCSYPDFWHTEQWAPFCTDPCPDELRTSVCTGSGLRSVSPRVGVQGELSHCQVVKGFSSFEIQTGLFSHSLVSSTIILWVIIPSKCHSSNQHAKSSGQDRSHLLPTRAQRLPVWSPHRQGFLACFPALAPTPQCHLLSYVWIRIPDGCAEAINLCVPGSKRKGGGIMNLTLSDNAKILFPFFHVSLINYVTKLIHSFKTGCAFTMCLFLCWNWKFLDEENTEGCSFHVHCIQLWIWNWSS